MPPRIVVVLCVTSVTLETPKVAMSSVPLGTVLGIQLVAVFQSPVVGSRSQVASPARTVKGDPAKARPLIHRNTADLNTSLTKREFDLVGFFISRKYSISLILSESD